MDDFLDKVFDSLEDYFIYTQVINDETDDMDEEDE